MLHLIRALAALFVSNALGQELPAEIAGRWSGTGSNGRPITQTFTLQKMEAAPGGFKGVLTWWTSVPKCKIEDEPLTGTYAGGVLAFDAKTKCDVAFRVELSRRDSGWEGKATVVNGPVLDVSAK